MALNIIIIGETESENHEIALEREAETADESRYRSAHKTSIFG